MSGQLRIVDWLTDESRPLEPVHAYNAAGPIPFRGVCGQGHWTVKAQRAEPPAALCQPCREVVAGAAFRALEEIAELEGGPAPVTRAGVA